MKKLRIEEEVDALFNTIIMSSINTFKEAKDEIISVYEKDKSFSKEAIMYALARLRKYYDEKESIKSTTAPKNNTIEGKAKMTLLPMDLLRKYLVPAYEEGVIKYSRESWRDGFPTSVMVDAALRHIEAFYWQEEDIDPDSEVGKHHLAGAVFSLLSILHTLEVKPELDDR